MKSNTLVASCFLGAFPPVDLRAVCLVRAIGEERKGKREDWSFDYANE